MRVLSERASGIKSLPDQICGGRLIHCGDLGKEQPKETLIIMSTKMYFGWMDSSFSTS